MDDLVHYDRVFVNDKFRLDHPLKIQLFKELDEAGEYDLSDIERKWSEDYEYLLSRGYQLRPRFHPGWTPSWRGTDLCPVACEDNVQHLKAPAIDAKRIKDGKIVVIKRISRYTFEAKIACMLSTPESLDEPMNHCVPIFDHFPDTRDLNNGSFIVMPLLRAFDDPPFAYVDEVIDFVRQTLEGLIYIHSHGIAHCDLSDGNIMMEGRALYGKQGFHPSDQDLTAGDVTVLAKPCTRRDAGFVKYYIIDFGLSAYFDDDSDRPRLVTGNRHQDTDVPELSSVIPYDPFPVDVFSLGNVFKRNFLDKYSNVKFLLPLCSKMTEGLPWSRPSAAESLALFEKSLSSYRRVTPRWRLHENGESLFRRLTVDLFSVEEETEYLMKLWISVVLSLIKNLILFPIKVFYILRCGMARTSRFFWRPLEKPERQPLLG